MKSYYILITSDFADMMYGKESTVNKCSFFGYSITTDGRYVCSPNSLNDFPEEFLIFSELTLIPLSISDFPKPPPLI